MLCALGEKFFEQFPVFKFFGDVNSFRKIFGFEVKLFQKSGNKFRWMKFFEIFPIELAAIDDAASTQVEEIRSDERRLGVVSEDVGVVTLGGGDALALFDVFERAEEIAIGGGLFVEFFLGGGCHALFETFYEVVAAAIEEQANIVGGFGVAFVSGEARDAGTEATVNVILQARARVGTSEIDGAGWNEKTFVDEVKNTAREARGKKWAEVERTVFYDAAGGKKAGGYFCGGGDCLWVKIFWSQH